MPSKTINIRPTTSVYATYKNIKYDPWTAIAEFVDNSTQSYYDHVAQLEGTKYWNGLEIYITYDKNEKGEKIIIQDNAFGMDFNDFQRAIMLDSPPKVPTRSEFGMGLKTAACWFGTMWSVESTELGSDVKYKATVDVDLLQKYKNENIEVEEIPCKRSEHGTVVTIWNLNRTMSGRQIGKMKDQLRGMYRVDIRTGKIHIYYNNDELRYHTPDILEETLPDGSKKKWKQKIDFTINVNNKDYKVNGFIGILDEGSTSGAGFTLIRRGRVIIGGYENCYRPEEIFEKPNSFVYQRLFGELNLDDWPVTQTKDSFDWYNGLEDVFIEKLNEICTEYKKHAREYRKQKPNPFILVDTNPAEIFNTSGVIDNVNVTDLSEEVSNEINNEEEKEEETVTQNSPTPTKSSTPPKSTTSPQAHSANDTKGNLNAIDGKRISFTYEGENYVFNYICKSNDPEADWLKIITKENEYVIEWNTRHPFFKSYIDDPMFLSIMQKFTFAFALAEIDSKKTSTDGKIDPGTIRTRMNDALKAAIKEN